MTNPGPERSQTPTESGVEDVSIVVPARNEEKNLLPLHARIRKALDGLPHSWRLLVVDDGSTDGTWPQILSLTQTDARVAGLRLTRNFGHQNALLAGLTMARGRAVVTMDADLQHPPEVLPLMIGAWDAGAQVVVTTRKDSGATSIFKRATSRAFYGLLSLLTSETIPPGLSDFRLLDRRVLREILQIGENRVFLRGLVPWLGFRSVSIPYQAESRLHGTSSYGLGRMLSFALTGITSMSSAPLRVAVAGGLIAALLSFCELVYVCYTALVRKTAVPGWASILFVNTFFFAILFLYLGILGEYVARIFENVRSRPRFVVLESANCPADAAAPGALER